MQTHLKGTLFLNPAESGENTKHRRYAGTISIKHLQKRFVKYQDLMIADLDIITGKSRIGWEAQPKVPSIQRKLERDHFTRT